MRAIFILAAALLSLVSFSQTIIFSENAGAPAAITVISNYAGWQNSPPVSFVSTSSPETDVRATTASTGYTGASGDGNIFFTNVIGRNLVISGINTSSWSHLTLSLGHYKSSTAASNELLIEVSGDGINYSALSYSRPTGAGTANWSLVTTSGPIPSTTNLHIRFTQTSTTAQFRIDDIRLTAALVLPVRFWGVRALESQGGVRVSWSNLTESGLLNYAVQRSRDGSTFLNLATLNPALNNGGRADYQYWDPEPPQGLCLYRIQAFEADGGIRLSEITTVERTPETGLLVYPNPLLGRELFVSVVVPAGTYQLRIRDLEGRQLHSGQFVHRGGDFWVKLHLPYLKKGIYLVEFGAFVKLFVVP